MDSIASFLTAIRNAYMADNDSLSTPSSKVNENIAAVLRDEGFIESFDKVAGKDGFPRLQVRLRYSDVGGAIREIKRISKPGCRVYSGIADLKPYRNGFGVYILSTVKGIMTDHDARKHCVGGEVLCCVF